MSGGAIDIDFASECAYLNRRSRKATYYWFIGVYTDDEFYAEEDYIDERLYALSKKEKEYNQGASSSSVNDCSLLPTDAVITIANQLESVQGASSSSVNDWSLLPTDVAITIANRLDSVPDFVALAEVCDCSKMNWTRGPRHPWSALFKDQNGFNVFKDGRYQLVPWVIRGNQYYGSPQGLILTIGPKSQLQLCHFFTPARVSLPALHSIQDRVNQVGDWFSIIHKFIIFVRPPKKITLVIAIFGSENRLAYIRRGFTKWVIVENATRFRDVELFQDQIYALCNKGMLVQCNLGHPGYEINPIPKMLDNLVRNNVKGKMSLVASSGNLLAVCRHGRPNGKRYVTKRFTIYICDFVRKERRRLFELGGCTLFFGDGNCWSILSHEIANCRSNRIYFIDNYWEQGPVIGAINDAHCIGVFDVKKWAMEGFQFVVDSPPFYTTPFCVTPTLVS